MTFYRMSCAGIIAVAMLSAGCSTVSELTTQLETQLKTVMTPEPAPGPVTSPRTAAHTALNEGIDLYDKGEFNGAIKRLASATEIWSSEKSVQTKALKYMAFSYCVTSRQTLCRQQFEKALRLDPAFDLAPGEKGHPLWGSVFVRAKRAK